jgi:hypothetical protein
VHIISQEAYGQTLAVTKINSIALHWCNRPHRANSLSFEVQQKPMATGKCQKKNYDDRNEKNEKKLQKRKRATK